MAVLRRALALLAAVAMYAAAGPTDPPSGSPTAAPTAATYTSVSIFATTGGSTARVNDTIVLQVSAPSTTIAALPLTVLINGKAATVSGDATAFNATVRVDDTDIVSPPAGAVTISVSGFNGTSDPGATLSGTTDASSVTLAADAAPTITAAVASDPDNKDNYASVGDVLLVNFSEPVTPQASLASKVPPREGLPHARAAARAHFKTENALRRGGKGDAVRVRAQALVDALFTFSSPIGRDYSGVWLSSSALLITIHVGDTFPPNGTSIAARSSALLKNAARTSFAVSNALNITGNWGSRPGAPEMVSFIAADGGGDADYGAGDTLTVLFSEPMVTVDLSTQAAVDAVFAFASPLSGDVLAGSYTGSWSGDARSAIITIAVPLVDPGIGVARVSLRPGVALLAASNTSQPVRSRSVLLSGSWALLAAAPTVTSIVVSDPSNTDSTIGPGDQVGRAVRTIVASLPLMRARGGGAADCTVLLRCGCAGGRRHAS
jgi:uncharacterized Zn-binding protein involved in type VI secretion